MQVKVKDFTLDMLKQMAETLTKGNEIIVKLERGNIVLVETKRVALSKTPISELQ